MALEDINFQPKEPSRVIKTAIGRMKNSTQSVSRAARTAVS
jgi:hypothetical protein